TSGGSTGQEPTFADNGSAINTAAHVYTVTPDLAGQHGSVMSGTRVDLSKTFDITFDINVGNNDNGADGMGFVLHNDPLGNKALGAAGGGKGMSGIKNGIGIEFDTYYNATNPDDIVNDHTNFMNTNGGKALTAAKDLGNIEDGAWHQVHVISDGQTISYTFDGVQMGTMSLATAETYLGSQYAYFGFTGGTGGLSELERVRLDTLTATAQDGTQLQIGNASGGGTGQEPTFSDNGSAINTAEHVFTITPDLAGQHGSVMSGTRVDLSKTFDITFDINVGNNDNGADGMGFVLHNDPLGNKALGAAGGGKGMSGIKNGIGIEFDTYYNATNPDDIVNDHTNFMNTNGGKALTAAKDLGNIEDGAWHQVHVISDGQTISYTFDGVQMGTMSLATAETYLGSQYAYFGFTGGTGGLSELERVRLDTLTATAQDGTQLQIGNTSGGSTGQEPTFADNGSAINTAEHVYTVTPDLAGQHGSVMSGTRVDLSKTFDITFDINVGNNDNGADGMGFVLHNDPLGNKALGAAGGGKGMSGIKNGIGIEFDTYYNATNPDDIVNDHTNFMNTNGGKALTAAKDLGNIEDGAWHQVHVISDGQTISYTFDGVQMGTMSLATAETYLGSQYAYFGFTGGTGGLSELERVRLDTLTATAQDGTQLQIGNTSGGSTGQEPTFADNGSAINTAEHVYTVTPDLAGQHGSVMSGTRVDLSKTFDITFDINVGNNDNGADGMGFVLHNDPLGNKALGATGGGKGMSGIKNGIGIEFDTYYNATNPDDIVNDHTNFINTTSGNALTAAKDLGNIEDGAWHQVHVTSDGQTISYTFDGVQMGTMSLANAETYLGSQYAYFGFTGGTGGRSELERVRLDTLTATAQDGTQLQIGNTSGGSTGQEPTFADNGSAINTAAHVYTVTPDLAGQHGSVMSGTRV